RLCCRIWATGSPRPMPSTAGSRRSGWWTAPSPRCATTPRRCAGRAGRTDRGPDDPAAQVSAAQVSALGVLDDVVQPVVESGEFRRRTEQRRLAGWWQEADRVEHQPVVL